MCVYLHHNCQNFITITLIEKGEKTKEKTQRNNIEFETYGRASLVESYNRQSCKQHSKQNKTTKLKKLERKNRNQTQLYSIQLALRQYIIRFN